jgi:molybdopterin molybdotransferase
MLTLEEALARIKRAITPMGDSEIATLKDSLGRVLAEPVHSKVSIPFDKNAAMDGYAFSSADCPTGKAFTLKLAGTSWAGQPFVEDKSKTSYAGQCVRIFTGAVVPEPFDSVIMQEQVSVDGETINFPADCLTLQNVRVAGEDVLEDELLSASGRIVSASDLGLFAAAGVAELSVLRRLKIIFFSTGDELLPLGEDLSSGKIYDSNRYLLHGLLNDACHTVVDGGVLRDDKATLTDALVKAAANYDVIITSGGASVGEADFIQDILAKCGSVDFWQVAIKPGKPFAFGMMGDCHFFGLPGNPLAVLVTFQQLVMPALKLLSGANLGKRLRFQASATSVFKGAGGRETYLSGILSQDPNDDGKWVVASAGKQGSHLQSTVHKANCYVILPIGCRGVALGEMVTVELFNLSL